jgi:hypothetical protein
MTWHDDRNYTTELQALELLLATYPTNQYVSTANQHIADINGLRLNHQ